MRKAAIIQAVLAGVLLIAGFVLTGGEAGVAALFFVMGVLAANAIWFFVHSMTRGENGELRG